MVHFHSIISLTRQTTVKFWTNDLELSPNIDIGKGQKFLWKKECKVFDFINRRDVCVNKDMLMMIKYLRGYI